MSSLTAKISRLRSHHRSAKDVFDLNADSNKQTHNVVGPYVDREHAQAPTSVTLARIASAQVLQLINNEDQPPSVSEERAKRLLHRVDYSLTGEEYNAILRIEFAFHRSERLVHKGRKFLCTAEAKDENGCKLCLFLFTDVLCSGALHTENETVAYKDQILFKLHDLLYETTRTCLRIVYKGDITDYHLSKPGLEQFESALKHAKDMFAAQQNPVTITPTLSRFGLMSIKQKISPIIGLQGVPVIDGPRWTPDRSSNICQVCNETQFSLYNRRHHW